VLSVEDDAEFIERMEKLMLKILRLLVLFGMGMAASTSPAQTTAPLNYGRIPGQPLNFVGAWSSTTPYALGVAVSYNNLIYISLVSQNLNNTPGSSPSSWSVVVSPASLLALPTGSQTVVQPTATTFGVSVPGTASGRTSTTPVTSVTMTDGSALATTGSIQGDVHLTPYSRADIQVNTPNDDAFYENFTCNYTGTGSTGNCIPHFFIVGNTPADKHTGLWGGNSIVAEHVNTPSFGWEANTFNYIGNGDILPNGTYSAGPFFGVAATATAGTGYFTQQAAFLASDDFLGGKGGGWDYGLYVINANNAAVLCGTPANATLPACIWHSALGTATSNVNYSSVPDIDLVNTWTGTTNGIHTITTQGVPGRGTNPTFCKNYYFDGVLGLQTCSGGFTTSNGPLTVHAPTGGSSITIGQTFADTPTPGQGIISVDGSGNTSIQAIEHGVANKTLSLNPSGGPTTIGGGAAITSSNALPQVGTPAINQAACIKAAGPPVVIGFCSTAVSASGGCTCN
jgi:hypothetical protein